MAQKKDFFDYVSPTIRKYVKPFVDWCYSSRTHLIIVIAGIALAIIFASFIKQTLVISLLILLGGVSKIHQRYMRTQVGIEFIMLATVVTGYVYGGIIGGVVGFATFGLATYFSGKFSHNLFPSFIMIVLVGMVAPLFASVTTAGIVLTLIYDIILTFLFIAWFRGRIHRVLLFSITHFFWNVWVFFKIAPLLVEALI